MLISGIPGTGKTFIGRFLEQHHEYKYEDIEEWPDRDERFGNNPNMDLIDKTIEGIINPDKNLVATFGFRPLKTVDLAIVDRLLKRWNFKMFWFEGNKDTALREYVQRELRRCTDGQTTSSEFYAKIANFFVQIQNISRSDVLSRFNPLLINPFGNDEKFRRPEDLVREMESYFGLAVNSQNLI